MEYDEDVGNRITWTGKVWRWSCPNGDRSVEADDIRVTKGLIRAHLRRVHGFGSEKQEDKEAERIGISKKLGMTEAMLKAWVEANGGE